MMPALLSDVIHVILNRYTLPVDGCSVVTDRTFYSVRLGVLAPTDDVLSRVCLVGDAVRTAYVCHQYPVTLVVTLHWK